MFILFMDDQDVRHASVERQFSKEHTVLHAFNADEAIEIILSCKSTIGLAMLDHDMADFAEVDGRKFEKHGVYFLDRLFSEAPKEKWPAQFIIHSRNNVGSENMRVALTMMAQIASIIPFTVENLALIAERIKAQ